MAEIDEMQIDEFDEDDSIIELTDENGDTVPFEILDLISYEGNDYVVLLPADEESDEVVILRVEEIDDENENYVSVESEELLDKIFELFREKNKDFFDFED